MGQGHFTGIAYGVLLDEIPEDVAEAFYDLCSDHDVRTGYESARDYAAIFVSGGPYQSEGPTTRHLEDLVSVGSTPEVRREWNAFAKAAERIGVTLGPARMLWIADFD